jgi:hypothetical protein
VHWFCSSSSSSSSSNACLLGHVHVLQATRMWLVAAAAIHAASACFTSLLLSMKRFLPAYILHIQARKCKQTGAATPAANTLLCLLLCVRITPLPGRCERHE